MRRDLEDEKECGGRFHVAVTATLTVLAKAMVVVSGKGGKGLQERDGGVLVANLWKKGCSARVLQCN